MNLNKLAGFGFLVLMLINGLTAGLMFSLVISGLGNTFAILLLVISLLGSIISLIGSIYFLRRGGNGRNH